MRKSSGKLALDAAADVDLDHVDVGRDAEHKGVRRAVEEQHLVALEHRQRCFAASHWNSAVGLQRGNRSAVTAERFSMYSPWREPHGVAEDGSAPRGASY
jgi:hypothetical protein